MARNRPSRSATRRIYDEKPKRVERSNPRALDDNPAERDRSIKLIQNLAMFRCEKKEIAAALGVHPNTLYLFMKRDEEAAEAYERGLELAKVNVRRSQFKSAMGDAKVSPIGKWLNPPDSNMARFLGKNMLGQVDRVEHAGPNGDAIPININALSTAQLEQLKRRLIAGMGGSQSQSDG